MNPKNTIEIQCHWMKLSDKVYCLKKKKAPKYLLHT